MITEQDAINHLFEHIDLIEEHQVAVKGSWTRMDLLWRVNDWKDHAPDSWYENICRDINIKPLGRIL